MRKAVVWTLAAASLMFVSGLAMGQDEDRPQRQRAGRGERRERGERGPQRGERGPRQMNPLLQALDADKDGVISAEEIAKAREALLTLDANEDGQLTREEYAPRRDGRAR